MQLSETPPPPTDIVTVMTELFELLDSILFYLKKTIRELVKGTFASNRDSTWVSIVSMMR
jgi:hypothetical protein